MSEKWIMLVGNMAVHPSNSTECYLFPTKDEAAKMLKMCYPDQVREVRLGGPATVSVRRVQEHAFDPKLSTNENLERNGITKENVVRGAASSYRLYDAHGTQLVEELRTVEDVNAWLEKEAG